MEWNLENFLLANTILIISSILQRVTGVSVGMVIVPFLALISYSLIPVPIVFASLTLTIMMATQGKEHIDFKGSIKIIIGMVAGILASVFILSHIEFEHLGLIFGVFIILSVLISLKVKSFKLKNSAIYFGGLVAGIMGTMAAVGGQILALIYQNHPLPVIKATLAFLYTIFSIVMLTIFYFYNQFNYSQFISGLLLMPGFIIGFFISPIFTKYFNPKYSKVVVLSTATFGALTLIYQSLP